jgi:large subunit ribosomal protein L21e
MVKRIGSPRHKTRHKYQKKASEKGKISLRRFFQTFEDGQKVVLKCEPAYHNGMYFHRFHGKVGIISGMQGKCYNIKIKDFNKDKTLIVHPVHLRKV